MVYLHWGTDPNNSLSGPTIKMFIYHIIIHSYLFLVITTYSKLTNCLSFSKPR